MSGLQIVAGAFGKGHGQYEAGEFSFPDGSRRAVETVASIEAHSGVAAKQNWGSSLLGGLKGGLALASNLELSGTLALAASAVGAGLSSLDENGESKPCALIEVTFSDGAGFLALAAQPLSALIENDREVVRRAIVRFAGAAPMIEQPSALPGSLVDTAAGAATTAAEVAGAALKTTVSTTAAALSSAVGRVKWGQR